MADKFAGGVKAGSTSVELRVHLRKTSDGTGQTGIAHGSVTNATYRRQGGLVVDFPALSALTNLDSGFTAGGWKEEDATKRPGFYRLDAPDAAFASGADWVSIVVKVANTFEWEAWIPLESQNAKSCFDEIVIVKGKTQTLPSAITKNLGFLLVFDLWQTGDPNLPATGLSPLVEVSKDAGAYENVGTATEIAGSGSYSITTSNGNANGNALHFRVTATGARPRKFTIYTKPATA